MAQSPASPDPKPLARFPYVAALLCAACLGMAAWTWMRYSYAWEVGPKDVVATGGVVRGHPFVGRYVMLRGYVRAEDWKRSYYVYTTAHGGDRVVVDRASSGVPVGPGPVGLPGRIYVFDFRPVVSERTLRIDTTASRFTGASIAGLVVGAMGVFVFTVALRHWLGERRRFREET